MSSDTLTQQIKNEIAHNSETMCDWLDSKLTEDGPWQNRNTEKETLNCLMRYHLNNSDVDNSEVCQYLNNDDDDEAWVESVATHVAPAVMQTCR